jgi:hypothetical protein
MKFGQNSLDTPLESDDIFSTNVQPWMTSALDIYWMDVTTPINISFTILQLVFRGESITFMSMDQRCILNEQTCASVGISRGRKSNLHYLSQGYLVTVDEHVVLLLLLPTLSLVLTTINANQLGLTSTLSLIRNSTRPCVAV